MLAMSVESLGGRAGEWWVRWKDQEISRYLDIQRPGHIASSWHIFLGQVGDRFCSRITESSAPSCTWLQGTTKPVICHLSRTPWHIRSYQLKECASEIVDRMRNPIFSSAIFPHRKSCLISPVDSIFCHVANKGPMPVRDNILLFPIRTRQFNTGRVHGSHDDFARLDTSELFG